MTIQAQTPDGAIHEFPDGTPDSVIDNAMRNYLQPQTSTWSDVGRSAVAAGERGLQAMTHPLESVSPYPLSDTAKATNAVTGAMMQSITGVSPEYEGKTFPGRAVTRSSEFAPYLMGGEENIIPGVVRTVASGSGSEAAQEAAKNSGAGEVGQTGASILGAVAGGLSPEVARKTLDLAGSEGVNATRNIFTDNTSGNNLPKFSGSARSFEEQKSANDALGDITSGYYKKADELGASLSPDVAQNMVKQIRRDIGTLVPKASPQTSSLLDALESDSENGLTLSQAEEYRKQLGRISWNASNPNDAPKAQMAKKAIDSYLETAENNPSMISGGSPDAITALSGGRAAHALESNHDTLLEIARQAHGDQNIIQSKLKTLFDNRDEFYNFPPEDRQVISDLAHPSGLNNALEKAGKIGFGAGNKSLPAWGDAGSAAIALATGNPLTAAGFATALATGTAANMTRGVIVRNAFDRLLKNIEARSIPVDQTLGSSGFSPLPEQPALPAPTTPALPAPQTPFKSDWSGNVSPMSPEDVARAQVSREAWPSVAPGEAQPAVAHGDVREPMTGTGQWQRDFMRENRGRPVSSTRGQEYTPPSQTPAGQELEKIAQPDNLSDEFNARYPRQKRGGAVLTPAQIREINKKNGKTKMGRKVKQEAA